VGEELVGHDRADRVQPGVVGSDDAGAVAVEASHRVVAAGLELATEHVALGGGLLGHGVIMTDTR